MSIGLTSNMLPLFRYRLGLAPKTKFEPIQTKIISSRIRQYYPSNMKYYFVILFVLLATGSWGQGFVAEVEEDGLSSFFGNPCTVELNNGEVITGKLSSGNLTNGFITNITVKSENGEKLKFKPDDVKRLSIKTSKLAKLTMISESASSIKKMTQTDFDDIVNLEYIIFESALAHNKSEKIRLVQLLNPGFDSKIKVFGDPNPNKKTSGLAVGAIQLTGGEDKSYFFVQNNEKAVLVKKGNYDKNFIDLYSKCPIMLGSFTGKDVKWADVAGHVFAYDKLCE
jgi:small nuclear ribonucleoprotein (snRNP)-like protein